jgi:hypothetical protein
MEEDGSAGASASRLGNFTRGRGYPRILDPTSKGTSKKLHPHVWIATLARGQQTG